MPRRRAGVSVRARHLASLLIRWLVLLGVEALVLLGLTAVLGGVQQISFGEALLVVLAISLVNAFIWPAVIRLALPLTLITFGLASLAMSAGVVALSFLWATGSAPAFGTDLLIAAVLALVSTTLLSLLDFDGDARNLSVVRRRARHARAENRTDVPGVILFEIDGLGQQVLRAAVRDGHAPTIARWLEAGSHKLIGWECDLSSQTGASQAGLLLGSNWDMPAFRWHEKESGRTLVSNHPRDAAEIERRRSNGHGLLAERRHEPRQHVLRRRAALHDHDGRDRRPQPLARLGPVRLLRRPVRPAAHDLAVAGRRRARALSPRAASAAQERRTSTAPGCTRLSERRSRS